MKIVLTGIFFFFGFVSCFCFVLYIFVGGKFDGVDNDKNTVKDGSTRLEEFFPDDESLMDGLDDDNNNNNNNESEDEDIDLNGWQMKRIIDETDNKMDVKDVNKNENENEFELYCHQHEFKTYKIECIESKINVLWDRSQWRVVRNEKNLLDIDKELSIGSDSSNNNNNNNSNSNSNNKSKNRRKRTNKRRTKRFDIDNEEVYYFCEFLVSQDGTKLTKIASVSFCFLFL